LKVSQAAVSRDSHVKDSKEIVDFSDVTTYNTVAAR